MNNYKVFDMLCRAIIDYKERGDSQGVKEAQGERLRVCHCMKGFLGLPIIKSGAPHPYKFREMERSYGNTFCKEYKGVYLGAVCSVQYYRGQKGVSNMVIEFTDSRPDWLVEIAEAFDIYAESIDCTINGLRIEPSVICGDKVVIKVID